MAPPPVPPPPPPPSIRGQTLKEEQTMQDTTMSMDKDIVMTHPGAHLEGETPTEAALNVLDLLYLKSREYDLADETEVNNNNNNNDTGEGKDQQELFSLRHSTRKAKSLCLRRTMHLLTCKEGEDDQGCASGEELEREMIGYVILKRRKKLELRERRKEEERNKAMAENTTIDLTSSASSSSPPHLALSTCSSSPPSPCSACSSSPETKAANGFLLVPLDLCDADRERELRLKEARRLSGCDKDSFFGRKRVGKGEEPAIIPLEGEAGRDPRMFRE